MTCVVLYNASNAISMVHTPQLFPWASPVKPIQGSDVSTVYYLKYGLFVNNPNFVNPENTISNSNSNRFTQ